MCILFANTANIGLFYKRALAVCECKLLSRHTHQKKRKKCVGNRKHTIIKRLKRVALKKENLTGMGVEIHEKHCCECLCVRCECVEGVGRGEEGEGPRVKWRGQSPLAVHHLGK